MDETPLSAVRSARRAKIVDAARGVFVARGFRATTMEGIAEAVGMSKVTVYGYFSDKEALFAAVAEQLAADLRHAFLDALEGSGTLADRVASALIAKHDMVHETVRRSPFAAELFSARNRVVGTLFADLDAGLEAALAGAVGSSGRADPEAVARQLFGAAQGIANKSRDWRTTADDIAAIVHARLSAG